MDNPKLQIERITVNGKPAIELIIRNATKDLRQVLDGLGIKPTADISNRRSIVCATPAELDAARNPLAVFFDRNGEWIA